MHNHSEKIEPKKLAITIVLAILLFTYAYMTRGNRTSPETKNKNSSAVSSSTQSNPMP